MSPRDIGSNENHAWSVIFDGAVLFDYCHGLTGASFRASGVISSHVAKAWGPEVSAFFRSAGASWTTPVEISLRDTDVSPLRDKIETAGPSQTSYIED